MGGPWEAFWKRLLCPGDRGVVGSASHQGAIASARRSAVISLASSPAPAFSPGIARIRRIWFAVSGAVQPVAHPLAVGHPPWLSPERSSGPACTARSAECEMHQRVGRPGQVQLRERDPDRADSGLQPQMCARERHRGTGDDHGLGAERGARDVGAEIEINRATAPCRLVDRGGEVEDDRPCRGRGAAASARCGAGRGRRSRPACARRPTQAPPHGIRVVQLGALASPASGSPVAPNTTELRPVRPAPIGSRRRADNS